MTGTPYRTTIAAIVFEITFGLGTVQADERPPLLAREVVLSGERVGEIRSEDYQQKWSWSAGNFFSNATALEMCEAIKEGDLATIDRLIETFDINHRGRKGMTVLLYSLAFPVETSRRLLERGADPNLPLDSSCGALSRGTTATQIIAGFGSPEDFQFILDHGTDPHLICPETYIPLIRFTLTNPANCKILLAKGADINQQDASRGNSYRSISYPTTSPKALLFYLEAGGDYRKCYPLRWNLLLNLAGYEPPLGQTQPFLPPEPWAAVSHWFKTEKHIDPQTVLQRYQAHQEKLSGHDAERTILALAAPDYWLPPEEDRQRQFFDDPQVVALARAIDQRDIAEINRLAEAGADFSAKGKCGVTPLFWATQADLPTFVSILAGGADPNAQLSSTFYPHPSQCLGRGDTIAHWAVRFGQVEHLLLTLQAGGNPNARRVYYKRTPLFEVLDVASLGTDMAQTVENVIAMQGDQSDLLKRSRAEHRLLAMSLLRLAGADFDAQDVWGRTPAMLAFKNHQNVLTFMLLQFGAGCRPVDKLGYDLMLLMIQDKRYDAWNYGADQTPQDRLRRREAWDKDHAEIIAIIQQRGGDFELAEQTVWHGDDWQPAIDLTTLAPADRMWLPADETGNHSIQEPDAKPPRFPGIIEFGTLPVMPGYRSPPSPGSRQKDRRDKGWHVPEP